MDLEKMTALALAWPFVCPAPLESGHTVLGRLPAFALGVWFGTGLPELKRSCLWGLAAVVLLAFGPRTLWPVGYLLVGAALSFGSKAVSRRFPEEKQPVARAAFQISGLVLAIIGFIIAIY